MRERVPVGGAGLSIVARVLAAADAYHAMTEERPHRPARTSAEAARELELCARDGSLDLEAVRAVLTAAGQATSRRINWPAGLSDVRWRCCVWSRAGEPTGRSPRR